MDVNNFFRLKDCVNDNKEYRSISIFEKICIDIFSYLNFDELKNLSLVNKEFYYLAVQTLKHQENQKIQSFISCYLQSTHPEKHKSLGQRMETLKMVSSKKIDSTLSFRELDCVSRIIKSNLISSFQYLSSKELTVLKDIAKDKKINYITPILPKIINIFRSLIPKKNIPFELNASFISNFTELFHLNMYTKAQYLAKKIPNKEASSTLLKLLSDQYINKKDLYKAWLIHLKMPNKEFKRLQLLKINNILSQLSERSVIKLFDSIKNKKLRNDFFISIAPNLILNSQLDLVLNLNKMLSKQP